MCPDDHASRAIRRLLGRRDHSGLVVTILGLKIHFSSGEVLMLVNPHLESEDDARRAQMGGEHMTYDNLDSMRGILAFQA